MSEALVLTDDAALFNDPDFTRAVQERTRAKAKAFFHGRGFDRLVEIAQGEDDKMAMSAITAIGKIAGEFKAPRPIQLSFDELMRARQAGSAGPLAGMTDIVASEVIDADSDDNE